MEGGDPELLPVSRHFYDRLIAASSVARGKEQERDAVLAKDCSGGYGRGKNWELPWRQSVLEAEFLSIGGRLSERYQFESKVVALTRWTGGRLARGQEGRQLRT